MKTKVLTETKEMNKIAQKTKNNTITTTIIFDLGGVVVSDSDPVIIKAIAVYFDTAVEKIKYAFKKTLAPYSKGLITGEKFSENFLRAIGTKKAKSSSPKKVLAFMKSEYLKNSKMYVNIMELIKSLKKKYFIAALSNTVAMHEHFNKQRGLFKPFHKVFLSNRIHLVKKYFMGSENDSEEIYLYVCRKLRVHPEECIFIDDMKENLISAKDIGMKTIHYKNYNQLMKELKKYKIKF